MKAEAQTIDDTVIPYYYIRAVFYTVVIAGQLEAVIQYRIAGMGIGKLVGCLHFGSGTVPIAVKSCPSADRCTVYAKACAAVLTSQRITLVPVAGGRSREPRTNCAGSNWAEDSYAPISTPAPIGRKVSMIS